MNNNLQKDGKNAMIFGVCAGLSDYFNIDVIIIRLIFLVGTFFISFGFLVFYLILAVVIPERKVK